MLASLVVAACSGTIDGTPATEREGDPSSPSSPGTPRNPANPATPGLPTSPADPGKPAGALAGTMPMRRLGRVELANTLADLLGPGVKTGVELAEDEDGPSTYAWPSDVTGVERDLFERAATAASTAASIKDLAPCPSGAAERACADDFVKRFGKRAFRRPLLAVEVTRLLDLYDGVRASPASFTHEEATRFVLAAMLQSPQFLYRWELGPQAAKPAADKRVRLGGWEMASRLSYTLWATMPDAALFQAAESGELDTAAGVEKHARRMLGDTTRATGLLGGLFGSWLGFIKLPKLAKDKAVIATFDDALKSSIRQQTETFLAKTVLGDGKWASVLTSRESFINEPLAKMLGEASVTGTAMVPRTFGPERMGLFAQPAFLAIKALPQESSPVKRGKAIVERLLCRTIAPPPKDLVVDPPPIAPNVQTREAYAQHATDPACAGCHKAMDPYGFAFEHFDPVGKYRAKEAGRDVDASGVVTLDGKQVPFKNAGEFMTAIAASPEGHACVVDQWLRFGLGRPLVSADAPALAAMRTAFTAALDLRELTVAMVASDAFRFRAPAAEEVTQ